MVNEDILKILPPDLREAYEKAKVPENYHEIMKRMSNGLYSEQPEEEFTKERRVEDQNFNNIKNTEATEIINGGLTMTITITEKEYDAICEVLDQVETDFEAVSNEEYIESMGKTISLVRGVLDKYKMARQKAAKFQQARAYVAERNPNLRPRDIDKMTRKLLKKIKED